MDKLIDHYLEFKGPSTCALASLRKHDLTVTSSPHFGVQRSAATDTMLVPGSWARRHRVSHSINQFDQKGLVGEVGIEPTLTALSRQCLRVYKARPKANISNSPNLGWIDRIELSHRGITTLGLTTWLYPPLFGTTERI